MTGGRTCPSRLRLGTMERQRRPTQTSQRDWIIWTLSGSCYAAESGSWACGTGEFCLWGRRPRRSSSWPSFPFRRRMAWRRWKPPSQFARFCLLSLERARRGSSPVRLRRFVQSLEKGSNLNKYTLFAGLNPAIGNVIEAIELSEEAKQQMRRRMSN